jgi:hypothetical protein
MIAQDNKIVSYKIYHDEFCGFQMMLHINHMKHEPFSQND